MVDNFFLPCSLLYLYIYILSIAVCDAFRIGDAVLVVGGDGQTAAVAAAMAMAPFPEVVEGSGESAMMQQQHQEAHVQQQQQQQHVQQQELQKGVPETQNQIPTSSSSQTMSTNHQGRRVEQTTNSTVNSVQLAADEAQGKG